MSTISDPAVAAAASPITGTADPPANPHSTHAQPSGWSLRAVAGAFLIGILAPVMLIFIIPDAREVTLRALGGGSTPEAPYDVPNDVIVNQAQSEGAAAYQDNLYVARWFAACSKFSAIEKMPPELVIWVQPFRVDWTSTSDARVETPRGLSNSKWPS